MSQSAEFHAVYAIARGRIERAELGDAIERAERVAEALRAQLHELENPAPPVERPNARPMPAPRAYPKPDEALARRNAQLAFHKAQIAAMGGSRTVRPAADYVDPAFVSRY